MRHLFALFSLTLLGSYSSADDRTTIHERLVHSTAWVRTTSTGIGTGWIVDAKRRWLVTNLHVVGDQDRVEAFFVVLMDGEPIVERQYYLENQKVLHESGRAVRGKVIQRRPLSDLALVELETLPDGITAIPLTKALPMPGDDLQSVGHRHDSDALWVCAIGSVRQIGRLTDGYFWRGKKLAVDVPCLLAQSPINIGDSGGPLTNARGELVGVLSGVRWQSPTTAIAIQVGEVRALLAQIDKKETPLEKQPDLTNAIYPKLFSATVWVRPTATEGRATGWIVDRQRRLVLTTSSGAGNSDLVDVLFPRMEKGELVAEMNAYSDRITARQGGLLVRGLVLARDVKRDLALIELEAVPERTQELTLEKKGPRPGEKVHTISHPSGVELLWLYAAGIVRQTANMEIFSTTMGEPLRPRVLLLQIPHQAGSAGGPVLSANGSVVGMMAAKEAAQQQLGFAIAAEELSAFLQQAAPLINPQKMEEYRQRGRWLLQHGRIEPAIDALERGIKLQGDTAASRLDLVAALLRAGRAKSALVHAERLASLSGSTHSAWLALVHVELGQIDLARSLCDRIIEKDRKCGLAWYVRSTLKSGKESIADLEEAIFHTPEWVDSYRRRADLREKLMDEEAALADWSRAIELDPYQAESVRRRAALYLRKNEPKRAVADYERLSDLLPGDAEAHRGLARAWLAQGDEAKAIPALIAALRWKPLLRKSILDDILGYGAELLRRWPEDSIKKAAWYERTLIALRDATGDASSRQKITEILNGRKKDWDDRTWGEELEKRLKQLGS